MTDRRVQLLEATIAVIGRRGVRGLRVQEVAKDAGVSVTLLYHYFGSREGLLAEALAAVSEHAARYGQKAASTAKTPREELVARLVGELAGTDEVRTNSAAWGELRWASVFEHSLRPAVHQLTAEWVEEIAAIVDRVIQAEGLQTVDLAAVAERLVALVEGLSGRWLTGAVEPEHLQTLLTEAIAIELPPQG